MLRKTRGGRYAFPLSQSPTMRRTSQLRRIADRRMSNRRRQGALARAGEIRAGRFRLLNSELSLPDPVDWRLAEHPDIDALCRFHLHYHEFLLDLMVAAADQSDPALLDRAWQLVRQWIVANPLTDPRTHVDAWHPFCISRRLPVWIALWQISLPPESLSPAILESMFRQSAFLASHLELDLGGNHLLENAHALALAGSFFDGADAERWLRISRDIFERELPEQLLEHGEHYERSPMYHAQMLDALLDVRDATVDLAPDLARRCGNAAGRMAAFLAAILHPDGEIPLLGDSAMGESPPAGELIRQASDVYDRKICPASVDGSARRVGDYWTWRDGGDYLLLDGGPVGPDHLPAHAHSDLSTFELSMGGQRLVVDSGVFAYRDDDLRRYCRSTGAHNVLQIDDFEQCDTWSRFRMGYRGRPVAFESARTGNFDWVRFEHNAYRRIGVPIVGRWVACRRGGPWLIVDWAEGRGPHSLTNRLHLHPAVEILEVSSMMVTLRLDSLKVRLGALNGARLEIHEGSYCPEFGRRLVAPVICVTMPVVLPAVCGWWFDRDEPSGNFVLQAASWDQTSLHWSNGSEQMSWQATDVFGIRRQNGRPEIEH